MNRPRKLGLFGFGAFGRLAALQLAPYFEILVHDPSPAARRQARRWNVRVASLAEAAACPFVVLAAPISRLEELAREIAPHIRPRTMVFDVASVKIHPAEWLSRLIPADADVIGTHPLFGPQSASRGVSGLETIICPVRTRRLKRVVAFLERGLSLKVSVTSPDAHDRALAAVQGLTHMIGKVLAGLEPLPDEHSTPSYEALRAAVRMVQGDSDELFLAIQRDNPHAVALRQKFFVEIEKLKARLDPT